MQASSQHDLLPSVRQLSQRYRISPVTVTRGLKRLVDAGRIVTKSGVGTFVAAAPHTPRAFDTSWQSLALGARAAQGEETQMLLRMPAADVIGLSSGYPDERLQPHAGLGKAASHALRRAEAWTRSPAAGLEPLRAWFAKELSPDFSASDVLIAPGGQSAVAICLRALVPPVGGNLILETPTYFGALAVARSAGFALTPVPMDAGGVRPDWLEAAFKSSGSRVAYLQPNHHNPTGITLAFERRKALLEVAAKYNAFLIEDDYAHDFTLSGAKPRPLVLDDTDGRVIYIRSLTKSSAPSLRVAAIIARGPALERLRAQLAIGEMFTPQILQLTALELVGSLSHIRHLKLLRQTLLTRRDALLHALEMHGFAAPVVPNGGFGLWQPLPSDDLEFAARALQRGVQISSGSAWFPAEKNGDYARLSFAASDEGQLLEAVRRLSAVRDGLARG